MKKRGRPIKADAHRTPKKQELIDNDEKSKLLLSNHDTVSMEEANWLSTATRHYQEHGFVFVSRVINNTKCCHLFDHAQALFELPTPSGIPNRIMGDTHIHLGTVQSQESFVQPVIQEVQDVFKLFMHNLPESLKMEVRPVNICC
jgi:hypothetical protein